MSTPKTDQADIGTYLSPMFRAARLIRMPVRLDQDPCDARPTDRYICKAVRHDSKFELLLPVLNIGYITIYEDRPGQWWCSTPWPTDANINWWSLNDPTTQPFRDEQLRTRKFNLTSIAQVEALLSFYGTMCSTGSEHAMYMLPE